MLPRYQAHPRCQLAASSKLFAPPTVAAIALVLTELEADEVKAFGLCDAGTGSPELGHVSLSALQGVRGPRSMRIVADPHFKPRQPLLGYLADAQRDGSIND